MEVLDPIVRDIIIGVILAGVVGLAAYIKRRFNKIDSLCQRIANLEKMITLLATMIEQQVRIAHPDIDTLEIRKMIDIMMKNGH